MSIAVVQAVEKNTLSSTISATGSGNGLIVCVSSYNATTQGTVSSVKLGTTNLIQACSAVDTSDGFCVTWIYYLLNAPSGQTGITVAGSSLSVVSSDGGVDVVEVSGLALSSALDKAISNNAANSTYSSGSSGTLAQADEFVIGVADGVSLSNASGWTAIGTANGRATGYKIVSSTAAQTYTGTAGAPGWCANLASFKAPSSILNSAAAAVASML